MNKARSIKQNPLPDALPNFRNLGVTLRILLLVNAMVLIAAILLANGWMDLVMQVLQISTLATPVMLASLLALWLFQPGLRVLTYRIGVLAVYALVGTLTLLTYHFGGEIFHSSRGVDPGFNLLRCLLLSVAMCSVLLIYFRLRYQVLSLALHDARLQVLRTRIRPHFLYNTINAVLGIVRKQPGKAETALEDMADLFRVAMADEQDLVPLSREIQLCKQYIALEQLRMGDRLKVDWRIQNMTEDALVPVLLLQPLLENAVYHGIEHLIEGGCIYVLLSCSEGMLHIKIDNPYAINGETQRHAGNKIALQNIRERLALLFDAEASYQVVSEKNNYRVTITLPYTKEQAK